MSCIFWLLNTALSSNNCIHCFFLKKEAKACALFYFLKVYPSVKSVSFDLGLTQKHATHVHPAPGYAPSRSGTISQVSFSSKCYRWTWIFHSMNSCSRRRSKAVHAAQLSGFMAKNSMQPHLIYAMKATHLSYCLVTPLSLMWTNRCIMFFLFIALCTAINLCQTGSQLHWSRGWTVLSVCIY